MKIYDVLQGSDEWVALRLGVPTASQFHRIFTPGGKASGVATSEKYMHELLAERMTGEDATNFRSEWMERGSTLEADAIAFYQLQRDCETTPVGFMVNDAGTIGASPDQLVDDDGQMEIKCPKPGVHVGYLLQAGETYETYKVQIQGQLWISGRKYCDVVSYHPTMPMALFRINRDDDYIFKMAPEIEKFSAKLEAKAAELEALGWMEAGRVRAATPKFSAETDLAFQMWNQGRSN